MTDVGSELVQEGLLRKSTDIIVNAEALECAPWVYFWMSATYPNKGGKKQGEFLKFDKKAGNFDLTFTLVDNSGLHLKFYQPFQEAMWVGEGPTCPPPGPGNGGGAILPGEVSDSLLEATNLNQSAQLLTFMLRFDGDTQGEKRPPYEYDPRIINGGG